MRKKFIAGNWKMNKNLKESMDFLEELRKNEWKEGVEVALFPPFLSIPAMALFRGKAFIGAQNVFYEKSGAFTGEISIPMLEAVEATHVIIGHSERREIFGESDEEISKKLDSLLNSSLIPVLCVGETLEEREAGEAFNKIKRQIEILKGKNNLKKLIIAYEPIWAIGTGKSATSDDAKDMCGYIREILSDDIKEDVRILYGGSVKPSNAEEILSKENIDGVLVGGASLKVEEFIEIIKAGESYA